MKTNIRYIIILAAFLVLAGPATSFAKIWMVSVQDFSFSPATLPDVRLGDTIQWNWVSGSHTTTSTSVPSGAATWDHAITSASTSFKYVPAVAGAYTYKCTPHFSMGMVGAFTVSPGLGIQSNAGAPDITISPNPFSDRILVTYRSNGSGLAGIRIFDMTGKMVRETNVESQGSTYAETLDLQDLQNGIYFVRFIGKNNQDLVRRIIKY
jgi:plastocyanin